MSTEKTKATLSVVPEDAAVAGATTTGASDAEGEAFLFDEFFETAESKTFPLTLKLAGRMVTIQVKKGLSNADRNAAEMAAVQMQPLPNGGMKMVGLDQTRMTEELVLRAIVSWPFKHRDGSPVPITLTTVRALKGGGEAILGAISKYDAEGEAGLATFQENLSAPAESEAE